MSLYLCADCGGSKTAIAIASKDGKIVARAYGGPSNFAYLGLANFEKVIKSTVESALANYANWEGASTLPTTEPVFAAAWFGISGVDSPANVAVLTPVLSHLLSIPIGPKLIICNDAHLLAAPLQLHKDVHHAIAVIGGTGSIAASFRRLDDEAHKGALLELGRIGGWGWILGDEGGGFHVGREAIRQILSAHDISALYVVDDNSESGPTQNGTHLAKSILTSRIMERFGVSSPPELLAVIHDADPVAGEIQALPDTQAYKLVHREKRLSQLAPIVFEAAFTSKDALALSVLRETSHALARQVCMLLRPEDNADGNAFPPRSVRASDSVICFGGSLVGVQDYRDMVLHHLKNEGHIFPYIEFVSDPAAAGATGLVSQFESLL
ncbi:hypothetical protein SCHPADRAFT_906965 [Schizopora paradoxa]|uniref:N-acetyl-D-glucosamine kinase n=1 Tax=Schizopora paradoxa TaxID=27342 RepID=A0A0H2RFG0_9AGAM|nr:hypothetical protein SCHPADRAFT_906965 [Schizopora paradoxa]